MTAKILVSACLLGQPVRYDGKANDSKVQAFQQQINQWQQQGRLVSVCPEMLGGLPTPRPAAEIRGDQIITRNGDNVSEAFRLGAAKTLQQAQQHQVIAALLAARSPSCGSDSVYDGSFSGRLIAGRGITAELLEQQGIRCFSPETFRQLTDYLATYDQH